MAVKSPRPHRQCSAAHVDTTRNGNLRPLWQLVVKVLVSNGSAWTPEQPSRQVKRACRKRNGCAMPPGGDDTDDRFT